MSTPVWRKSSRSDTSGNDCVEVAALTGAVGVRDSKNPFDGHQTLSREAFAGLVKRIKQRDLDR
jgi:hypothetical protein